MIREAFKKNIGMSEEFRFRGTEPGRLENFSDAVFALAITLLLISTTPPSNFQQIKRSVIDLIPFTICVTFIVLIWYQHFIFFFRYGLRNAKMVALNAVFLTIVLFYVYPLKFLTKLIEFPIAWLVDDTALWNELSGMISGNDMADLMIIYGLGATAVFFTLMQMYRFALKQSAELGLNDIEIFDTKVSIWTNLLMGIVPIVSVLLALVFYTKWYAGMISGFSYSLYTPVMMIHGKFVDRKRKKLLENQGASSKISSEDLSTQ
jgi:uncharacterized membrane protein